MIRLAMIVLFQAVLAGIVAVTAIPAANALGTTTPSRSAPQAPDSGQDTTCDSPVRTYGAVVPMVSPTTRRKASPIAPAEGYHLALDVLIRRSISTYDNPGRFASDARVLEPHVREASVLVAAGRPPRQASSCALPGIWSAAKTAAKSCSFVGATLVLMSDGSKKPIDQVQVGDYVLATDPETGEEAAKRVEAVFVHVDIVVDLGLSNGEQVTTTEDHPFWSVTDRVFERADQLAPGELVLAADGRVLESAREALAYNLAINCIHTYHVGQSEILVHNICVKYHVRQRMAERGISEDMVDQAVRTGTRSRGNQKGTWKYKGRKVWAVVNNKDCVISCGWNKN